MPELTAILARIELIDAPLRLFDSVEHLYEHPHSAKLRDIVGNRR